MRKELKLWKKHICYCDIEEYYSDIINWNNMQKQPQGFRSWAEFYEEIAERILKEVYGSEKIQEIYRQVGDWGTGVSCLFWATEEDLEDGIADCTEVSKEEYEIWS